MLRTPLCDLLNIQYPIIQGGMAWIADASLASSVSNSGGLGVIAAMSMPAKALREEIRKTRELTDKPFGVNIMLMSPYTEEVARVVCEEKVEVVTTGAGSPAKYMPMWIDAGIKVIPVIASTGHAKKVERSGAIAVIAEGSEAGGHVGELSTMSLVPQVCDSVNIPVIAAGGIADGRTFAAAIMLGAIGAQVGTRFLVAKECAISQAYKDKVIEAKDIDTIVTGKRLGHPVRSLKTTFSRMYSKYEYDNSISNEELEEIGAGVLRLAAIEGDLTKGCFMAGQSAGLVKEEQTAKEIIEDIVFGAREVFETRGRWIV